MESDSKESFYGNIKRKYQADYYLNKKILNNNKLNKYFKLIQQLNENYFIPESNINNVLEKQPVYFELIYLNFDVNQKETF